MESKLDHTYLTTTYSENGVFLSSSEKFKQHLNENIENVKERVKPMAKYFDLTNRLNASDDVSKIVRSNSTYFVSNENANLGWSLATADLNRDQSDDLSRSIPFSN